MLHLLRQCGGGGVRYQRCSSQVEYWTLTYRMQGTQLRTLHQTPHNTCQSVQKFKLDFKSPEQKDHLLYVAPSSRFYKWMNFFAFSQFVFWLGLGYSILDMKTVEVPKKLKEDETLPWWRKYDFSYLRLPMGIAAFAVGWGVFMGCWLHTLRSVQHIVLRKGGKTVTIATHTPFGSVRENTVPLDTVSAVSGLIGAPNSYMTLKVKGHILHFLLDAEGNFVKPALYEKTVGVRRNFAAPMRKE